MEVVIVFVVLILGVICSIAAFFLSVYCLIKIKAAEQSKFEVIQANPEDLFETDMNKINKELEDDEIDEEITNTFEEDKSSKPLNEVII